jgi:hypothetical protein
MVSTAIELGYMLFTSGPDEAVEPLILGIAGAALLVLSEVISVETQPPALVAFCHALSGLILLDNATQGVALGWYVTPLWGYCAPRCGVDALAELRR